MANTLLLERPVKSERAVRQKREEWGQVGEAIVRAAVNNSSKPIFEELGKRVAELGTDEQRKNLGSALGNLRAGKTRQELEIALAKFGMEENSAKQLIRIIEINFSSYSEFGAIFESCGKSDAKSFAREFASKYAEMSGRVENYIWKSSDANIKAALNPLELSDYERPLANYLVRKHFGMTKEELAANLGAAKGDEISIVREFTESTVSDKAFQKARDGFKGAYGEFGAGEVLQSMDLLSQKAFLLDALPKLEKWGRGRENLGAFIRERLVPALADGVMPKQAIFPLFASEVHVERAEAGKGKLEKTAGTIAFLMDKTDYYFEDFRNAIFPLIVAKLGSVYNEGGLTRERAAFNFVSEQVQTALIKAQGAWFKRLIEGFLANPAAFSAFTQQVPQLRDSDLKSLSQQTADELIRLIDQRVIRPDSIKTPLDFSIMGLVQDKDVKNTLLKLRWAFSPGSLSIIPSVDWTKSVALATPQDAFIYELMARPVLFRVNLPTVLTTGVFSGNANYSRKSADGITTAAEGTALQNR